MPGCENGVSEIIGAVLLISVVVLGLSIAGVVLLSTPPPQKIPAISVDITRIGNTIYLRHEGGDTLERTETKIFVDGSEKTDSFSPVGSASGSGWSFFAVGDVLYTDDIQNEDSSVLFVYTGGSAEQTLLSIRVPTPTPDL